MNLIVELRKVDIYIRLAEASAVHLATLFRSPSSYPHDILDFLDIILNLLDFPLLFHKKAFQQQRIPD